MKIYSQIMDPDKFLNIYGCLICIAESEEDAREIFKDQPNYFPNEKLHAEEITAGWYYFDDGIA